MMAKTTPTKVPPKLTMKKEAARKKASMIKYGGDHMTTIR